MIAKPIEASAAATVKINKANSWPNKSLCKVENKIKFKFNPNRDISIPISTIRMLLRLYSIPSNPVKNKLLFEINCSIHIFCYFDYLLGTNLKKFMIILKIKRFFVNIWPYELKSISLFIKSFFNFEDIMFINGNEYLTY